MSVLFPILRGELFLHNSTEHKTFWGFNPGFAIETAVLPFDTHYHPSLGLSYLPFFSLLVTICLRNGSRSCLIINDTYSFCWVFCDLINSSGTKNRICNSSRFCCRTICTTTKYLLTNRQMFADDQTQPMTAGHCYPTQWDIRTSGSAQANSHLIWIEQTKR